MIDDIDARFPSRDRDNDGTIGDSRHQALGDKSDHNPHVHLGPLGIVTALDITHDPGTFDAGTFAESLRTKQDPRIKYLIFDGRIFSSTQSPWEWRERDKGPGDHSEHVHISVVDDPALYDDPSPWDYDLNGAPSPPTIVLPPTVRRGDSGPAVVDLQTRLGLDATGIFGESTEAAVRAFQEGHNLFVDGIVGSHTWGVLTVTPTAQATAAGDVQLTQDAIKRIISAAAQSPLVQVQWAGSRAPIGYIKGMAVAFGLLYAKFRAGDSAALAMAAADSHREKTDALSFYAPEFRALGLDNSATGPDTLRHLLVFLFGLGMSESSGQIREGRYTHGVDNEGADTAEAGLFQMSWNMRSASAEMPRLFALYSKGGDGFLPIFREGVPDIQINNSGTGEGFAYQTLCKSCPAFAVETAALGVRLRRTHWGTIRDHKIKLHPEVDLLFQQVQKIVDASGAVAAVEKPSVTPAGPASNQFAYITSMLTDLVAHVKEKPMPQTQGGQAANDIIKTILTSALQILATPQAGNLGGTSPLGAAAPQFASVLAQLATLVQTTPAADGVRPQSDGKSSIAPDTGAPSTDPVKRLGDLLQLIEALKAQGGLATLTPDQLKKIVDLFVGTIDDTRRALGPVNGALGQGLGVLLNGKKSAIGIIGSLVTGLLQMGTPELVTSLSGPLAALLPGLGQFGLPIFLAITAWGFLGKLEKWASALPQPTK